MDTVNEIRQVLYSADPEEGTYITYDIVEKILKLMDDYENYILKRGN